MKMLDPDTLLRIQAAAESEGGTRLPSPCSPREINDLQHSGHSMATTSGCGRQHLFALPYSVEDVGDWNAEEITKRGGGMVIACAQDDEMELWPRIAAAMREEDNE